MSLSFIPNQPWIFEQALPDQPCLNNDTTEYSQLVAPGDTICIQQIMEPCTADILCDPNMVEQEEVALDAWTVADGWSSADKNHVSYDGASAGGGDICEQSATVGFTAGNVFMIDFEITSITGTSGFYVQLGSASSDSRVFDTIGRYQVYLVSTTTADVFQFIIANPAPIAGDTVEITIFSQSRFVAECWRDGLNIVPGPSWLYTYNDDDPATPFGTFCSFAGIGADLINDQAYTVDGNYHTVEVTVTELTTGGLEVILGGEYLGSILVNGSYTFYGVPTDASQQLILRPYDDFEGCISHVNVDDYGLVDNTDLTNSVYKLTITDSAGTDVTDEVVFEVTENRITWCFNIDDITFGGNPVELGCDAGNRIKITAQCTGEIVVTTYTSINTLRYDPNGWDCTYVMQGYSDGWAFGFYFGSVTAPVFTLTQRLRVLQFAPRYPALGEEYLHSNGSYSRSWAQSGKIRQCWFDYVDELTHDVIRLQILSDVLTIDSDVHFAPVKDYEPEWDEHRRNLAQSRIDLVKDEVLYNSSCNVLTQEPCTTNVVTTPPITTVYSSWKVYGAFRWSAADPTLTAKRFGYNYYLNQGFQNPPTPYSGATFTPITGGSFDITNSVSRSNFINTQIPFVISSLLGIIGGLTVVSKTELQYVDDPDFAGVKLWEFVVTGTCNISIPANQFYISEYILSGFDYVIPNNNNTCGLMYDI